MLAGYVKVMLNLALMFSLYYPVFVFLILSTLTSAGNRTRAQKTRQREGVFPTLYSWKLTSVYVSLLQMI